MIRTAQGATLGELRGEEKNFLAVIRAVGGELSGCDLNGLVASFWL